MKQIVVPVCLALAFLLACAPSHAATHQADIVIYGGTSAAISAAVQAKRMGRSVIVVSPNIHLGGLSSGGLGWTDSGDKRVIGGIAREFYQEIDKHYQQDAAWTWQTREDFEERQPENLKQSEATAAMWLFEPHVAEDVFERWVKEYDITVHRDRWLNRESGIEKQAAKIQSIETLDGTRYVGRVFLDATYEGDLMAAAGVSYYVGRESNAKYGETWNGVQTGVLHHNHHFGVLDSPIDPYQTPGDPSSGLLSHVSPDPPGEYGTADHRIQAYCFRLCMTKVTANRTPFSKPEGYDPAEYELLVRIYQAGWKDTFRKFDPVANGKTDTNNCGPMSTDYIGMNYDYPEGSYEQRRKIAADHERYQRGWLYFIATDPRIPVEVQKEMNQWGLAKDEFVDNENWPHQIYVREARRMIGVLVQNENHLLKRIATPKSVGMGSYTIDSHNVQRYVTPDGHVQNEGDIGVSPRGPYEISYDSLTPKTDECENLLVPVCVSCSHVAYGSIRMEPVFMILGQSAATAASLAIESGVPVQKVPYRRLKQRLAEDGQVLEASSSRRLSVRQE